MTVTALSPILAIVEYQGRNNTVVRRFAHWCIGCNDTHEFAVETPFNNGARWTYNGNPNKPTFSPSMNIGAGSTRQCHYFIADGRIQYLNDCHHKFAGQTLELPEIPEDEIDVKTPITALPNG